MARPRAFDRDQVLDIALDLFREKGFASTSTDDLVNAMGIGRQSLYAAFGDKRSLYLEALQRYSSNSVGSYIHAAGAASSPLQAIEALLLDFADQQSSPGAKACLGVNAVCEFGTADPEISRIGRDSGQRFHRFLERTLRAAQTAGEIAASVDPAQAAQFIAATLAGMKISARSGADAASLRSIAQFAMRSLAH